MLIALALVIGIVLGGAGIFLYLKSTSNKTLLNAQQQATAILADSQKEVESLKKEKLFEAEEEIFELKQKLELEYEKRRDGLKDTEKSLDQKELEIDRKAEIVSKKEIELLKLEDQLRGEQRELREKSTELAQKLNEQTQKLEEISGLNREQARELIVSEMRAAAEEEGQRVAHTILEQSRLEARRKAQEIIIQAIQQIAAQQSVEATVSVVELPNDDMKGRIIGREGRNIRAFELTTGVDVIIDDTPDIVVLSSYNSYRREIAKRCLEKLVHDGRIHPARIEEVKEKTEEEMKESVREIGEQTLLELGIHGVAPELTEIVGKLQYRTSYGQNVLAHSVEVAHLCGIIAAELGIDARLARRAGIMHDIGKGLDNHADANHAKLGADWLRKYNEHEYVVNAAEAHHNERDVTNVYTIIVMACDEISANRPGARRESLESFIKRMEQLENIAAEFTGVQRAYAIQAGREIRVIADTSHLDDAKARELARNIAKQIQLQVEFPGQIKVTVIREFRAYNFAS